MPDLQELPVVEQVQVPQVWPELREQLRSGQDQAKVSTGSCRLIAYRSFGHTLENRALLQKAQGQAQE